MDKKFWIDKWLNNEIGFHRENYNPNLENFWDKISSDSKGNVFVPLCGKTKDINFFVDRGHKVYGCELSRVAIESFFKENHIPFKKDRDLYYAKQIFLYCNDIFLTDIKQYREIEYIYDRASIVALPEETRDKYVSWLKQNFPKVKIFLETFSFESEVGPPFSINEQKVNDYFSDMYNVQLIQEIELEEILVHSEEISSLKALTFILTPK